jgi:hypothetical protein
MLDEIFATLTEKGELPFSNMIDSCSISLELDQMNLFFCGGLKNL